CDALRFVLATGGAPGNDFRLSDDKLEGGRNFANKIWNASRFVIQSLEGHGPVDKPQVSDDMPAEDRWILGLTHVIIDGAQALGEAGKGVDQLLEDFQIGEAGQRLHGFFWHSFCDWYIEMAKLRLRQGDTSPLPVMAYVLDTSLRLLHPFMPFVTEAVWQKLRPHLRWADTEALIVAPWPQATPQMMTVFWSAKEEMDIIRDVVQAIRDCRTIDQVQPSVRTPTVIVELAPALRPTGAKQTIETNDHAIRELARANEIRVVERVGDINRDEFLSQNAGHVNVYVRTGGVVDLDAQRSRLSKQMAEAEAEVGRLEAKLGNAAFREKAPAAVVAKEEDKLAAARARLEGLRQRLAELG
ncbi:MAG: class I tRNA ligase family protein, partial [Anaerolineae bacterium]|nr:class I tRNA ligase family protein [Anaerolineae bacterium]